MQARQRTTAGFGPHIWRPALFLLALVIGLSVYWAMLSVSVGRPPGRLERGRCHGTAVPPSCNGSPMRCQWRLPGSIRCFSVTRGGVIIRDAQGGIVFANAQSTELLGLDVRPEALLGMEDEGLRSKLDPDVAQWLLYPGAEAGIGRQVSEGPTAKGRFLEVDHIEIDGEGKHRGHMLLLRDITRRKQHELQLAEQASTDALTGLNNRRSFMQHLSLLYSEPGEADATRGVVMMLDIDRFKRINDTYGHAIGDIVLHYVAALINSSMRPTDVSGRYGGEEFVVLQPHTALEDGVATAERVRQHLEEAVIVAGEHEIHVTMSIGLAVVDALHPPETALQQADEALYVAKNGGRNRVSVWEPAMAAAKKGMSGRKSG